MAFLADGQRFPPRKVRSLRATMIVQTGGMEPSKGQGHERFELVYPAQKPRFHTKEKSISSIPRKVSCGGAIRTVHDPSKDAAWRTIGGHGNAAGTTIGSNNRISAYLCL
jgi:hypothetical protein